MSPQVSAGSWAAPPSQPRSISDVPRPSVKLDGGRVILVHGRGGGNFVSGYKHIEVLQK
jgi:hypothetical protein